MKNDSPCPGSKRFQGEGDAPSALHRTRRCLQQRPFTGLLVGVRAQGTVPAGTPPLPVPEALSQSDVEAHIVYKMLTQFSTPKDIKVSVSSSLWPKTPDLDPIIIGKVLQWQRTPPTCLLKIEWEEKDGTQMWDTETLHVLLAHDFKLLVGPNGEALRLHGAAARAQEAATPLRTIDVPYKQGAIDKVQTWAVQADPECIIDDARTRPRSVPTINRRAEDINTPFKMWRNAMLPPALVSNMFRYFNLRLDGLTRVNRKTTIGEIIRFLCAMGALALYPGVPLEKCWQQLPGAKQLFPPLSFGKYGLGKNRFFKLCQLAGELYPLNQVDVDTENEWRFCEMPVMVFNMHMPEVITAGWNVGPDESGSAWRGKEGTKPHECPKVIFIERKPEQLCCELQDYADAQCGCILGMEINKGAKATASAEYIDQGYSPASDTNLRLSKPFHQSGRAWGGDSWFTGMAEMEALLGVGLFPYGDVKTHTSRIPIKELIDAVGPNSGDWAVFTTTVAGDHKVYALGHRRGGTVHTYLSSHGQTLKGKPQTHKDDVRGLGYLAVPRPCPLILNDWTALQPRIDMQNRWRQDLLAMEKRFVTQSFPFRLFTTILGMTFGNTFTAGNYFVGKNVFGNTFLEMMNDLCFDGLMNDEDTVPHGGPHCTPPTHPGDNPPPAPGSRSPWQSPTRAAAAHKVCSLRQIPGYKGGHQQKCSVCGKDSTHVCATCSTSDIIFSVCNPDQGKRGGGCLREHKVCPDSKLHSRRKPSGATKVAGKRKAAEKTPSPPAGGGGGAGGAGGAGSRGGASSSWDARDFFGTGRGGPTQRGAAGLADSDTE